MNKPGVSEGIILGPEKKEAAASPHDIARERVKGLVFTGVLVVLAMVVQNGWLG